MWWPKDSGWWRREHIVELGEEFGPTGPAVMDWLSCEAKAQNDRGYVKAGYRACARGCFAELVTVRHVVSSAVALGALDDFEDLEGRFKCRVSGWAKDNERGKAAMRQAAARAARNGPTEPNPPDDPPDEYDVTQRDVSRPGTTRHDPSRQVPKRTGELTTPPLSPPRGGKRNRRVFHEECESYGAEHFPELAKVRYSSGDASRAGEAVRQAVESGCRTDEEIQAHVEHWFMGDAA